VTSTRWADRFMIPSLPTGEVLRRTAWTLLTCASYLLVAKVTSLVAFLVVAVALVRRLRGRKSAALPIAFCVLALTVAIPIELDPHGFQAPPRLVPVAYGLPGPEAFERAERGEIILGGCCVHPFSAMWVLVW
jgi:hypothetical protein